MNLCKCLFHFTSDLCCSISFYLCASSLFIFASILSFNDFFNNISYYSWNTELEFDIVDQYTMTINVYHQTAIGNDILLGTAELSLLNVYRNGQTDTWVNLKQQKKNGGVLEIGILLVVLKFQAPPGIAYPQYRTEVDSFDDTVRKILPERKMKNNDDSDNDDEEEKNEIIKNEPINTIPDPNEKITKEIAKTVLDDNIFIIPEFTEEEIIAAFKFIDLNHNNYIGASEIRHILICMGELITDEEIDMMISMIDVNGDGQISYNEFRSLVLHKNPEKIDLHQEIQKELDKAIKQEKLSLSGKSIGLDLKTFQRQKELTLREKKKMSLINLISDYEYVFEDITKSFDEYLLLTDTYRNKGKINFDTFSNIMHIEKIVEYQKLHKLYDNELLNVMDFKEFLLGLMNFIQVDREIRIRFSFLMFDEYLTGKFNYFKFNLILFHFLL